MLSSAATTSLLTFCEGVRCLLVPHGPDSVRRSEADEALRVIEAAHQERVGESLAPIWEAVTRADLETVKVGVADALLGLTDNPVRNPLLWKRIFPDECLLAGSVFQRDARLVASARPQAHLARYFVESLAYKKKDEVTAVLEPESVLKLVSITQSFFEGAATYARVRGAYSISENLIKWVILASEHKSGFCSPGHIAHLIEVYQVTGRPISANHLRSLSVLQDESGMASVHDWENRLKRECEVSKKLFDRFLYLTPYSGRLTAFRSFQRVFDKLLQDMHADPMTSWMVTSAALLMTTKDGMYDVPRADLIRIGDREKYTIFYPQLIPVGNLDYFGRNQRALKNREAFGFESEELDMRPAPLRSLSQMYQTIFSIHHMLANHMRCFESDIVQNPNPSIVSLKEELRMVESYVGPVEEPIRAHNLEDVRHLFTCWRLLEKIHYWATSYMTPLGQPRTARDHDLMDLHQRLSPYYKKVMEALYVYYENVVLDVGVEVRLRKNEQYKNRMPPDANSQEWLSRLLCGDVEPLRNYFNGLVSVEEKRGVISVILENKNNIEQNYRNRGDDLTIILEFLWEASREDVDIALWLYDLHVAHQQFQKAHSLLTQIFRFAGPSLALAEMLNHVAGQAIYLGSPPVA